MRRRLCTITGLTLWLLVSPSAMLASENLISNPGFELVPGGNPSTSCFYNQGILPSDWEVVTPLNYGPDTYSNDGSYGLPPSACGYGHFTDVQAFEGIRWVAAWSAANEQFGQYLLAPLVPGTEYEMSGWLHSAQSYPNYYPGGYEVYLVSDVAAALPETPIGFLGPIYRNEGWVKHSFIFEATDEMAALTFLRFRAQPNEWGDYTYPGLDLVHLAATLPPNEPPIAEAGDNQSIHVGDAVALDGSGSSDDLTASEDLQYSWQFDSVPVGSAATLTGAETVSPSFTSDALGDYEISLVVTDEGGLSSDPDMVVVSTENSAPNADAGEDQGVLVGTIAELDGTGSADPDDDPLNFAWTIRDMPAGSAAVLEGSATALPSLQPDLPGAYDIELIVNDGYEDSDPDTVTVLAIGLYDYVCERMTEAMNLVADMPEASFTSKGNKKALSNFLKLGCEKAQLNEREDAIHKLEQALSRTDGCILVGEPDQGGGGPGPMRDFVIDCLAQEMIYPLILEALEALDPELP